MRKLLLISIILMLIGCSYYYTLDEGYVIDKQYISSKAGTSGGGVGFTTDGKMVFGSGGTSSSPEKYILTIKGMGINSKGDTKEITENWYVTVFEYERAQEGTFLRKADVNFRVSGY